MSMRITVLFGFCVVLLGLVAVPSVWAANLFEDDFESYTVNSSVPGTQWAVVNFATTRDESTATPFGVTNQYAELDDASTGDGLDLMSANITGTSGAVTTYAFDFLEPSTGGSNTINIGYAMENQNVLSTGGHRLRITAGGGTLNGMAAAYSLDTAYRLYMIFNDTAVATSYAGGTIDPGTAHIWLKPLSGGSPMYAGAATNSNTQTATYRVGFTTWNADTQSFLVDNVSVDEGVASDLILSDDAIIWTDAQTSDITTSSAWATATVNKDLTTAILVWDTSDQGIGSTSSWSNQLGLGPKSSGTVTAQMATGLAADTAYFWRFYGENAITNGWSLAETFATALSSSQTPIFTNVTTMAQVISLGWQDRAATETGYILQRSTSQSSGYETIATLAADVTAYMDRGLTPETTYYYQLSATNSANGSSTAFSACQTSATTLHMPDLWSPGDIETVAWFDAADTSTVTEVSGAVSQWADKSGNGYHAGQSTAAAKPQYVMVGVNWLPAILNDDGDFLRNASFSNTFTNVQILVVSEHLDQGAGRSYQGLYNVYGAAGGMWHRRDRYNNTFLPRIITSATNQQHSASYTAGLPLLTSHAYDGASSTFYLNGSSKGTLTVSGTISTTTIDFGTTGEEWQGYICEVVILADVGDTERQTVEGYLAHKWGVADNLPPTHPYKNEPPMGPPPAGTVLILR